MESIFKKPSTESTGAGVALGCISMLCAFICLCFGIYVSIFHQQISSIQNYFPKMAATPSSTPVVYQLSSGDKTYRDDFLDNKGLWSGIGTHSEVYVSDGKLFLTSRSKGSIGIAECAKCPKLTSPYFIQADFSTREPTDQPYGIAFSGNDPYVGDDGISSSYLFQIDAKNANYQLSKSLDSHTWILHILRNSALIRPHPQTNTLAVSMDDELIVLLINGEIVDTYQDTGTILDFGYYWIIGNGADFTLMLDNLYAYGK